MIKRKLFFSFWEQKDRDLELAARIGQALLKRNHLLLEQNESLEEQLGQTLDRVSGRFSFFFPLFRGFFPVFFSFFSPFMMVVRGLIEIYCFIVKGVIGALRLRKFA